MTTISDVLNYSDYCTRFHICGSQSPQSLEAATSTCKEFEHHATFCVKTPSVKVDQLYQAIEARFPQIPIDGLCSNHPKVFAPLIPNLPLAEKSLDRDAHPLLRAACIIGLIVELIFRELISLFVSLSLTLYSCHNEGDAAYLQLRLDINRHDPYKALSILVLRLTGGH